MVNSNYANGKGTVIVSNGMRRPSRDDCSRAVISLYIKRHGTGDPRVAAIADGLGEIGDQGLMPVERERHRISAAAGAGRLAAEGRKPSRQWIVSTPAFSVAAA